MKSISSIKDKKTLKIISELRESVIEELGSSLKEIVLYGSYARNEQNSESDIDFLIFIDEETSIFDNRKKISNIRVDLSLKYDVVLSIIIKSYKLFKNNKNIIPFFYNVNKEGVEVYG